MYSKNNMKKGIFGLVKKKNIPCFLVKTGPAIKFDQQPSQKIIQNLKYKGISTLYLYWFWSKWFMYMDGHRQFRHCNIPSSFQHPTSPKNYYLNYAKAGNLLRNKKSVNKLPTVFFTLRIVKQLYTIFNKGLIQNTLFKWTSKLFLITNMFYISINDWICRKREVNIC